MDLKNSKIGVLNDIQLTEIIKNEYIRNFELKEKNDCGYHDIDGSSLELHLSSIGWKVKSTAKVNINQTVEELINHQLDKEIDVNNDILYQNQIYIIKIKEKISFDKFNGRFGLYGRVSGKSSIGRLDILTRLIIDYYPKYDEIPPNYNGNLYIEIIPLSFNIKLKEGLSLNQLRIFIGKPELSRLNDINISQSAPMLYLDNGIPILSEQEILRLNLEPDLNIDIEKHKPIAFCAKSNKDNNLTIDLSHKNHKPVDYWDIIDSNNDQELKMTHGSFYILRSLERMFLPNDVAVTCVAYSENLGELRIHYAGFAHPNFGRFRDDNLIGAPLIFEARCHSFDVTIKNEERFAKIEYYNMSLPTNLRSGYSDQELKLSNYFEDWQ